MSSSPSPSLPKLLLTGARGKLASAALPSLEQHFDTLQTDRVPLPSSTACYRQADILDFSQILPLMHGMDAVAHLAIASSRAFPPAETSELISPFDEMTLQVNIQGTHHVFEAARRAGVKKIVYLSSMTAHLGNKHRTRYDDTTPLEPKNLYACTKIFGENLGRLYAREHGISVICLRIGQPYPVDPEVDDIWRSNKRARTIYVTTEDITRAILCALKTTVPFGVYHIVSASDNPRVDLTPAREIGFVPRGYFSDDGLTFHDDGLFPPHNGKFVTQ